MGNTVKVGVIGFGRRGKGLLSKVIAKMDDVEILAICDLDEGELEAAAEIIKAEGREKPFCTKDYKELLAIDEIEAVVINTSWQTHAKLAIEAMNAGKYAGFEVGGTGSLEECFQLVETYERTGVPCMMLENCCYGRSELMVLNMVKKGLFGEIAHCTGGYHHYLPKEELLRDEKHYRINEYILRNCENYPTHEFGPLSKILNINRGNRMLTLSSTASKAVGINQYVRDNFGSSHPLANARINQGDIITTVIKCALGETVVLTLDTTLPRPFYSRGLSVRGTKGAYDENTRTVFLEGMEEGVRDNEEQQREHYEHPIWKNYEVKGGHGGMDWLVFAAFFDSVKRRVNTPIDAYDSAAWMSITALSEQSVALGGMPVPVPDFTKGRWTKREPVVLGKYCLDEICE